MNTVVLGIVKTDFHFCVLFNRSYEQCVLDPTEFQLSLFFFSMHQSGNHVENKLFTQSFSV